MMKENAIHKFFLQIAFGLDDVHCSCYPRGQSGHIIVYTIRQNM
jgi:hypothetical protein